MTGQILGFPLSPHPLSHRRPVDPNGRPSRSAVHQVRNFVSRPNAIWGISSIPEPASAQDGLIFGNCVMSSSKRFALLMERLRVAPIIRNIAILIISSSVFETSTLTQSSRKIRVSPISFFAPKRTPFNVTTVIVSILIPVFIKTGTADT